MLRTLALTLAILDAANGAKLKACTYTNTDCSGDGTCVEYELDKCVTQGGGSAKMVCKDKKATTSAWMNTDCSGKALVSVSLEDKKCYTSGSYSSKVICPAPCFSRMTTVCKILDAHATPAMAFNDCFGEKVGTSAERVPTPEIGAGDLVLGTKDEIARVIVTQHQEAIRFEQMVHIEHETGSLELTPDHVLLVDGEFVPAREVKTGSSLSGSKVSAVSHTIGGIVNPLTTSGKILIAGMTGEPVVSSTYPEWSAKFMLGQSTASLSSALSYLFPGSVQAFYNEVLEHNINDNFGVITDMSASPAALYLLGDLGFSFGFIAYSLFSLPAIASLIAGYQVVKAARKA